jgi:serine protease AprX
LCGQPTKLEALKAANWLAVGDVTALHRDHPRWQREDGACPACIQQILLARLLEKGDAAFHTAVQAAWPLDAQAAFGALPTPLRLHADPRFAGKGITIAFVDVGFYPHPDLTQPQNRIRAWVDVSTKKITARSFSADETPHWPGWNARSAQQWHGLMTSCSAVGNGWLSHGLYRGLASSADVALVKVGSNGRNAPIPRNTALVRALQWLGEHAQQYHIRVVNLSIGGEEWWEMPKDERQSGETANVDRAVEQLVGQGITVVAASGNDGLRHLVPPATAPNALTIGGIDDQNSFDHDAIRLWHSNYGVSDSGFNKPELVAPSIWVVAPVLPHSEVAQQAQKLFAQRGQPTAEAQIADLKLVTPDYQHVEGTSFAAPIVASVIACLLEANPDLTPAVIREILIATAQFVPHAPTARQGAGVVDAGQAIALALHLRHSKQVKSLVSPEIGKTELTFRLYDNKASQVALYGSWNKWKTGILATQESDGYWQMTMLRPPAGWYRYKFLLDGHDWLHDPANPHKVPNRFGSFDSLMMVA